MNFEPIYSRLAKIQPDKLLHYICLQLLVCGVLLVLPSSPWSAVVAFALALVVAIKKELNDLTDPHHKAEVLDVVWGLAGGLPLYAVYLLKALP